MLKLKKFQFHKLEKHYLSDFKISNIKYLILIFYFFVLISCKSKINQNEINEINKLIVYNDFELNVIDSLFDKYEDGDYLKGMKLICYDINGKNIDHKNYYKKISSDTEYYIYIGFYFNFINEDLNHIENINLILKDSISLYYEKAKLNENNTFIYEKKIKEFEQAFKDISLSKIQYKLNELLKLKNNLTFNDIWINILLSEIYTSLKQYEKSNELLYEGLSFDPGNPLLLSKIVDNYIYQNEIDYANQVFSEIDTNYKATRMKSLKLKLDSLNNLK